MIFTETKLKGAFIIDLDRKTDERGFFARAFCQNEFRDHGLKPVIAQANIASNAKKGTLRGMHFQWPPSREGKLVRCLRGSLFDVLLDLRPESPSYLRHISVSLDEENRDAVFIPHGVAHGFQTLSDSTEVLYQMTDLYAPDLAGGFRWNDSSFGIEWPVRSDIVISDRDALYRDFDRQAFEAELARRSGATA